MLLAPACEVDAPPVADGAVPAADAGDPTVLEVRFEPDGEGFWRTPWPSDARLTERGTPALSDFSSQRGVMARTLAEIESEVRGFANMAVVYFVLDAPVSEATLRQGGDTLSGDSPLQLIDLSEEGCGARVPLEVGFAAEGDSLRAPNTLQLANAIGTVLEPGRPYGAVILRAFGGEDGRETRRPAAFEAALEGGDDALARSLAPLRRCAADAGLALDDVAVATVFTPQDPVAEMRALRGVVMDPARVPVRAVDGWRIDQRWSDLTRSTFTATAPMPIFQNGETPYDAEGGRLVFDEAGEPIVQRWEDVPIAVTIPAEPGDGPRPLLVFSDGTGWRPWLHLRDNLVEEALAEGYVVASFMPQFHGGRAGFVGSTEVSTFNLPNPPAARANFRQQAAETSYFLRVIEEAVVGLPGVPALDTDAPVYGGHSQGALVGGIVAAVEDRYAGYVLNGLASNLTQTILFRTDLLDFRSTVRGLYNLDGELDRFHPLLQIIQLGAEVVDPHNYATLWRGDAALPSGNHLYVVNGYEDTTTTPRGMDHLTMAGDLPPIAPPGWDVDPAGVWDGEPVTLPVQGNATSFGGDPLTLATFLDRDQGHFTIYRVERARALALGFWRSAREGVPRLE